MKLSTLLPLSGGLAVGYLLGAAAGGTRYEQLRQRALDLWHHPRVQQTLFDVAGQAKTNAHRIPGPAASLIDTAATRVQDRLTQPDHSTEPAAPAAPEVGL